MAIGIILGLALLLLYLVVAAIPLYLALRLLGADPSFRKAVVANLTVAAIAGLLQWLIGFFPGILISFVLILFILNKMFDIGWGKAFIVLIVEIIIIWVAFILMALLGIGFLASLGIYSRLGLF
ncbi:hypothetical protein JXB02_06080 [Candidatus Woesearchaeota archaeon]|nr:hypothetical protein [Candidatus Woesearchaeota archaeon]